MQYHERIFDVHVYYTQYGIKKDFHTNICAPTYEKAGQAAESLSVFSDPECTNITYFITEI